MFPEILKCESVLEAFVQSLDSDVGSPLSVRVTEELYNAFVGPALNADLFWLQLLDGLAWCCE